MSHEGGENPIAEQPASPLWQRMAWLGVGYFLLAWLGEILSGGGGTIVNYWLPGGLFVAVLLLNNTRDWPWLMLSIVPANALFDLLHDSKPDFAVILMFCVANVVQGGSGAWMVRRLVAEKPALDSLKEFFGLMFFAGVAGSAIGATIAATMLAHFHLTSSFVNSWKIMWGGDAMAVLVLTPLVLAFCGSRKNPPASIYPAWKVIEASLVFGGLVGLLWYLAVPGGGVNSQKITVLVFILWAGLRFGLRGAAAAVFLLAIESAYLMTHFLRGLPPPEIVAGENAFNLQVFVTVAAMVGLVPPIVLRERDRTLASLRESEEKFSKAFRASPDGLAIAEVETGRYIEVNEGYCQLYGWRHEEVLGHTAIELGIWENLDDRARFVNELKTAGRVYDFEVRTCTRTGVAKTVLVSSEHIELGGKLCHVSVSHDITNRIQAEQSLRESEEKFSKAFRASPNGMAISEIETGRFIEVNEGYCQLYGWRREEMLGHTSLELGIWADPQDRARFVSELKTAGRVHNFEARTRTRAGVFRIILVSSEPIEFGDKPCHVSVLRDVTERRQAESALRESEEKFSKAFHTSPDVISITDVETGCYVEVNDAHEKTYGYKREEVVGRSPLELGIQTDPVVRQKLLLHPQDRPSIHNMEMKTHTRDGRTLTMLHSAELIEIGGRWCVLRVSHNITEQKRAEAEREQAVSREQQARIEYTLQLIVSQEAERKRIAVELHDSLGQNLLLIKNRVQLALLRGSAPVDLQESLAGISELASACIAEVRQISHDLHPPQLDHLGLTRALEAMIEKAGQACSIQFTTKLDGVDELFLPDAAMNLYRVVQESLNNILKHSHAGRVTIRLERDIHEVQLQIEDDGDGFAPDASAKNKPGLGLKNIGERVRMLGGKLNVDSQPGHGTRIEVTIPIAAE